MLLRKVCPSKEELGYADSVYIDELGDTPVVVFKQDGKDSRISTIVIRGATDNYMDDIERAIDDGVNTFKGITKVLCQNSLCNKILFVTYLTFLSFWGFFFFISFLISFFSVFVNAGWKICPWCWCY